MANWKEIEAREAVRIEYERALQKRLEGLGVQFRIAHFTGDSSYPTEYTLTIGDISAVGPTFDLALVDFVEKLLRYVPVEKADAQATFYHLQRQQEMGQQEKPEASYLDDPTRVEPGWLGEE